MSATAIAAASNSHHRASRRAIASASRPSARSQNPRRYVRLATRVWDAATGRAMAVLKGHKNTVRSAAFSPDGSRIVTASEDRTARVWDAAAGKAIAVLSGHEYEVKSAAFSPDGSRIVTASSDKTARVWDAATGKAILVLSGHEKPVNSAAFSPDGSRIVTASDDNTARLWDVSTIPKGNILQVACKLLNGNFNLEGVTSYPLTFDRPICATDPPPPDLMAEPAAPPSRR
jgi:WD40 repeat protein